MRRSFTSKSARDKYNKERMDNLNDLIWNYVQASIMKDLAAIKSALLAAIDPVNQYYITDTCTAREPTVITAYTKQFANLDCNATQRSESYHPVVRQITNDQLSLKASAKGLISKCLSILKDLDVDEAPSHIRASNYVNAQAFRDVFDHVILYALQLIGKK